MPKQKKEINIWLKQVLELGPPILFFLIYLRIKEDVFVFGGTEYSGFIVATLVFVPILLIAMGILWQLTGELSRMQIFTAFMVIFFGGLTAWFNDERFFKMKTSIVYGVFALLLGIGLMRGRSYLEYVMGDMIPMREAGWMQLTRRLCICFALLAIANELVWRNLSTDLWVKIETFGFPIILFLFLWAQIVALQAHMIEEDDKA
ncbi:inner membrane-spanning protein YciB [Phaeobacter sp. 22II1-1F12B]|uniref:inner membrane-spanning protein YciB n=1 Tax=Phaeobacter sp. 22II1-1F12B TaxID=1317111 RepID=UPI000B52018F|nr:inner membrane-spanning protein YciB [Phaeobacter sp. 22II1-1F12B]OWU76267.1 Intracellular septation protein A [Phaeobacter sp. 22II1-1F12B]